MVLSYIYNSPIEDGWSSQDVQLESTDEHKTD